MVTFVQFVEMVERNDKTWCEAFNTYSAPDIEAAICNALTSTTTLETWGSGELTYTATNLDDVILKVCDRDYKFAIFDPYERIKELEDENERLKNMLKEWEM